jgi:hypothetical protein
VALLHAGVFYLNRFLAERSMYFGHAATGLMMLVLGFELRTEFVGLSWLVLALALSELGVRKGFKDFVVQGYWAGATSLVVLLEFNVLEPGVHTDWRGWAPQICGALILYGAAVRLAARPQGMELDRVRFVLFQITSFVATALMAAFLRNTLPAPLTAFSWAMLGLLLLLAGRLLGGVDLRLQSLMLAVAAAIRVWSSGLFLEGEFLGMQRRIVSTVAVIACLYAAEFLSERSAAWAAAVRVVFSVLASALLFSLLTHEVSGGLLTVAWGAQGVALLFAGFPLRARYLRLSGLALLLVCVGKLFLHDLRHLEMPFRVLSFLVLGVILIGVSFLYSRFRERISRYL